MSPEHPSQDVSITITITETTTGKLGIAASVPDHASGSVALLLAEKMLHFGRDAMNSVLGVKKGYSKARVQ